MKISKEETKRLIEYAKRTDKFEDKMISDMGHVASNPTLSPNFK